MKKKLYNILVFSADPLISEALSSIVCAINIRPILLRDYSEIKDKITKNTKALLIDEYIINKGKKVHIKALQKKYNFKIGHVLIKYYINCIDCKHYILLCLNR